MILGESLKKYLRIKGRFLGPEKPTPAMRDACSVLVHKQYDAA